MNAPSSHTLHELIRLLDVAEAQLGEPQATLLHVAAVLGSMREDTSIPIRARAHYLAGFAYRLLGSLADAENELLLAVGLLDTKDDTELRASLQLQLGLVYLESNRAASAVTILQSAVEYFGTHRETLKLGQCLVTLSNAYWADKHEHDSLRCLKEALVHFSAINWNTGIVAVYCGFVHIALGRGRYNEASERAMTCLQLLPEDSHVKNRIFLKLAIAECTRHEGDTSRALELLRSTTDQAEAGGYHLLQARGLVLQYHTLTEMGEETEARAQLLRAEALAEQHGFEHSISELRSEG